MRTFLLAFLNLLFLCIGCSSFFVKTPVDSASQQPVFTPTPADPHFNHVLIIVLENQNYEDAIADPYLSFLARQGVSFTEFHALFHPSYSNYLAMVTGKEIRTYFNHQINLNDLTIADLLKSKGLTWKNYADGFPGGCFKGASYGRYVRKHVPFMSFIPIQKHECENIVPGNRFSEDLQNNSLPNYMFYSPDLDHDGHDPPNNPKMGLVKASAWLKSFLDPLLQHQAFVKDSLIIITFDESGKGPHDTNHIYTVLLGDMVKAGEYEGSYNHYNLLRTIEENFGLSTLADGDGRAKPISGIWK